MTLTATTSRNTRVTDTFDGKGPVFPMYSTPAAGTGIINVGDLVVWDSASNLGVRTPVTQADMAYYMGVADQQYPESSGLDANAAQLGGPIASMVVNRSGIFWFYTTPAETYNPGDSVFFNETISVQTIVKSSNSGARTVFVGTYMPQGQTVMRNSLTSGQLSITGATGVIIPIWLSPKWPTNANGSVID
jgi:hypothetical protein